VHEDDRIALPFVEKRDFHAVVLKTLHVHTAQSPFSTPRQESLRRR
jgi:hypothetical protein